MLYGGKYVNIFMGETDVKEGDTDARHKIGCGDSIRPPSICMGEIILLYAVEFELTRLNSPGYCVIVRCDKRFFVGCVRFALVSLANGFPLLFFFFIFPFFLSF